jgi:hypothetical protein
VLTKFTSESGKLLRNYLSEILECVCPLLLCHSRKNNNKRNRSTMLIFVVVFVFSWEITSKGKVQICTGTEALYRPYGS